MTEGMLPATVSWGKRMACYCLVTLMFRDTIICRSSARSPTKSFSTRSFSWTRSALHHRPPASCVLATDHGQHFSALGLFSRPRLGSRPDVFCNRSGVRQRQCPTEKSLRCHPYALRPTTPMCQLPLTLSRINTTTRPITSRHSYVSSIFALRRALIEEEETTQRHITPHPKSSSKPTT
jgi:hypothetical protein